MALAVVFWAPATMRRAPWSRHDAVSGFCSSNVKMATPVAPHIVHRGSLGALLEICNKIDKAGVQEIVAGSQSKDR